MQPTPASNLRAARALVAAPGGWTQHALARDADGNIVLYKMRDVGVDFPGATCFCSMGALHQAGAGEAERCLLRRAINQWEITGFNDADGRTQADVVAAFDRAVALAEAAEQASVPA